MPKQKVSEEEIIRQSLAVFGEKGYHNSSMANIAEACGLLKGSIYHYFTSKAALMEAVIQFLHLKYKEKLFSIAYDDNLDASEKLQRFGKFSEELFLQSKYGCLMGNLALETANTEPALAASIKAFFEEWINAMAEIFSSNHDKETALQIAKDSIGELEGAIMLMRVFEEPDYLHRAHQRIYKRLKILQES